VLLPTNGSGFNGFSSFTFATVLFRLWVENESAWDSYIQGTGAEPQGPMLTFVVFTNNSSVGGYPHPPSNAILRTWFSPDGVFGLMWLGVVCQDMLPVKLSGDIAALNGS
jgi:hypothetical protein